ncbi:unnamed protein product, partial [Rotaria sp. Silwood2]
MTSDPNSHKVGKDIWTLTDLEEIVAAIASLGDRYEELNHETWRLNANTKLSTSLWEQLIKKLELDNTEKRCHSLYNIWRSTVHCVPERVKKELGRRKKNIIAGDNDNISTKEEVSVQKTNNVQLLPDPSLPLPEPPNTRTCKAKTVNGNIAEQSTVSVVSFILTATEWKAVLSCTKKELHDGWTKIFSDKLTSCGITCALQFFKAHIKKGKRKRRSKYFWCRSKCTGKYCTRSYFIKLADSKYTGKSRSRSRTPPYWRSTVKDRQRQHIHKEKDDNNREDLHSHRHERRRNDHHYHHQTESTLQHKQQSRSATTIKHKENDTSNTGWPK